MKFLKPFPKIKGAVSLQLDFKSCGKLNCPCSRGTLHGPYFYLRWREDGRQRRMYVAVNSVLRMLQEIAALQSILIVPAEIRKVTNE